jgi:hypothetical protein
MGLPEQIRRLAEAARSHPNPSFREAAACTGGLPVYADIGGVLLISEQAEVLHFDPDSRQVEPEVNDGWRRLALFRAAALHPELAALAPVRTSAALDCPACGGSGRILDTYCGTCFSAGWILPTVKNA